MVFEREMGRIKIQRPSQGDPLLVKGISHSPNGGLRALVVDVPGFKMLQSPGIHQYQRWMDDRSRVHQRAAEYVFAWLNGGRPFLMTAIALSVCELGQTPVGNRVA